MNIHRRHLTTEQKRELIAKLLKSKPEQSNRSVAKTVGVSHHTVDAVRDDLEAGGQIAHHEKRIGSDGVEQPTTKPTPPATTASTTRKTTTTTATHKTPLRKTLTDEQLAAAFGRYELWHIPQLIRYAFRHRVSTLHWMNVIDDLCEIAGCEKAKPLPTPPPAEASARAADATDTVAY
jgi:hypothetical protein